jgi:hypothetical protein
MAGSILIPVPQGDPERREGDGSNDPTDIVNEQRGQAQWR